jgi:hypothetical protein
MRAGLLAPSCQVLVSAIIMSLCVLIHAEMSADLFQTDCALNNPNWAACCSD